MYVWRALQLGTPCTIQKWSLVALIRVLPKAFSVRFMLWVVVIPLRSAVDCNESPRGPWRNVKVVYQYSLRLVGPWSWPRDAAFILRSFQRPIGPQGRLYCLRFVVLAFCRRGIPYLHAERKIREKIPSSTGGNAAQSPAANRPRAWLPSWI